MFKSFEPKKFKYKKTFRVHTIRNIAKTQTPFVLSKSELGLKALSFGLLSSIHFQAIKQTIVKHIKKIGILIFNGFPNRFKTKKKDNGRMGKGKGSDKFWFFCIKPGFIFCKILTSFPKIGKKALLAIQYRLPFKTKIID